MNKSKCKTVVTFNLDTKETVVYGSIAGALREHAVNPAYCTAMINRGYINDKTLIAFAEGKPIQWIDKLISLRTARTIYNKANRVDPIAVSKVDGKLDRIKIATYPTLGEYASKVKKPVTTMIHRVCLGYLPDGSFIQMLDHGSDEYYNTLCNMHSDKNLHISKAKRKAIHEALVLYFENELTIN